MAGKGQYQQDRLISLGLPVVAGVVWAIFLDLVLPSFWAQLLVGKGFASYPLSVQNVMWVVFFIGWSELAIRFKNGENERKQLHKGFLPEDEKTLLQIKDLGFVYKSVKNTTGSKEFFLPRMLQRIILQFQSSESINQAINLLNSTLELYSHEIDLRYNMLRYIIWLIPTIGFIGTIIGIANALHYAGQNSQTSDLLNEVTQKLAVAFNTTMLALIMSAILVFIMHIVQAREEEALNKCGHYCLDNLINRLFVQS